MYISKITGAGLVGLLGGLFFLDNLFNLQTAHQIVHLVVSGTEQPIYKIIGPVANHYWLSGTALAIIMSFELAIGALGLLSVVNIIRYRKTTVESIAEQSRYAQYACLLGMTLWLGIFVVLGEAYFNMWQYPAGVASVEGAFRYGLICVVAYWLLTRSDR